MIKKSLDEISVNKKNHRRFIMALQRLMDQLSHIIIMIKYYLIKL